MRMRIVLLSLLAGMLTANPLFAQDKSDAEWKKDLRERVLKRVQERLDRENKRIIEEVTKILDEELGPDSDAGGPSGGEEKSGAAPSKEEGNRLKKAMKKFLDESVGEGKTPKAPAKPDPEEAKKGGDEDEGGAAEEGARAFLGVATAPVSAAMRKLLSLEEGKGVVVQEVVEDAPAAQAGLESGDIILKIDGQEVGSPQELAMLIQSSKPGEKATITLLRKKETKDVAVVYGKRPGGAGLRESEGSGGGDEDADEDSGEEEGAAPPSPKPDASGKTPKFEEPPTPRKKGAALPPDQLREKMRKFLEKAQAEEAAGKGSEETKSKMKDLLDKTEGGGKEKGK